MSKASEFKKKIDAYNSLEKERPTFKLASKSSSYPDTAARVTEDGRLKLYNETVSAEEALALADWIQDTFGEAKP